MYNGVPSLTVLTRKEGNEVKKYMVSYNANELESDINNLRIEILSMDDLCMKDRYDYLTLYFHLTNIKDGFDESLDKICDVYGLIDEESSFSDKGFFPVWHNEIYNLFTVEEIKSQKLERKK